MSTLNTPDGSAIKNFIKFDTFSNKYNKEDKENKDNKENKENSKSQDLISPIKSPPSVFFTSERVPNSTEKNYVINKSIISNMNNRKNTDNSFNRKLSLKTSNTIQNNKDYLRSAFKIENAMSESVPSPNKEGEEKKIYKKKHKKTLSTIHLDIPHNDLIDSFKVNDEYYKKLLYVDLKKEIINEPEKVEKSRSHLKKKSCNYDNFVRNHINSALNSEKKSREKRNKSTKDDLFNSEVVPEVIHKKDFKIKKTNSDNRIFESKLNVKPLLKPHVKEEKPQVEFIDELTSLNKVSSKKDIFTEIAKNNLEYLDLLNFNYTDYNDVNKSLLSDEASLLNISKTDNFYKFESNDDYIKKILFN